MDEVRLRTASSHHNGGIIIREKRVWFSAEPFLKGSDVEAVYHVLNAMDASDDPDEILARVATCLRDDTKAEISSIFRLENGEVSTLELLKAIDSKGPARYLSKIVSGKLELDWGFLPRMLADFLPRAFDFAKFENDATAQYLIKQCGIRGGVCVPIVLDAKASGFFALLFKEVPLVSEKDQSALILLGGALGVILRYCDLLERYNDLDKYVSEVSNSVEIKLHADALSNILGRIERIIDRDSTDAYRVIDTAENLEQPFARLTQGELSVLALVANGFSNEEIAEYLSISEGTVKKRVGNLMMKLGLKNRTQLGVYFARFAR